MAMPIASIKVQDTVSSQPRLANFLLLQYCCVKATHLHSPAESSTDPPKHSRHAAAIL